MVISHCIISTFIAVILQALPSFSLKCLGLFGKFKVFYYRVIMCSQSINHKKLTQFILNKLYQLFINKYVIYVTFVFYMCTCSFENATINKTH